MINGAMETADTAKEPAGLPSGASQALKVGGGTLSDQNKPSPAPGAVAAGMGGGVGVPAESPALHLPGRRAPRQHSRTRKAQGSEITHSGSQIRSEAK